VLTLQQKHLYFACDTALFGDMKLIGDMGLDLAVVPIGDLFTMGPEDAVEAVGLLRPKHVLPSHFNTWPPIAQDALAWAQSVDKITGVRVTVLHPGDTFKL
jgi:L-ascorbate metabolism protein UlaG (beta-lactamase superfamily)